MGTIADAFKVTFADGPSSSPSEVDKASARLLGPTIENQVSGAAAGMIRWANLPGMPAGTRIGQPGQVTSGADKGEYSWTGSVWVKTGELIDPVLVDADIAAQAERVDVLFDHSVRFPTDDGFSGNGVLPTVDVRKGKLLGFNEQTGGLGISNIPRSIPSGSVAFLEASNVSARRDAIGAAAKADVDGLSLEVTENFRSVTTVANAKRPGDSSDFFVSDLAGGNPADLPYLAGELVDSDAGRVLRVSGAGLAATRVRPAIEPGKIYQLEYVVQRRTNSSNPSNDTVRLAIAWYDQKGDRLAAQDQTVVLDLNELTVAGGRTRSTFLMSRSAGSGISVVAPAAARYARPFVQVYGTTARTDIEVIAITDVTDSAFVSPDLDALDARISAQESLDLGARVTGIEAEVTAPNTLRVPTKADAVAAAVPITVNAVEVQGEYDLTFGRPARYVRVSGEPSHEGKFQSADGAWFGLSRGQDIFIEFFGVRPGDKTLALANSIGLQNAIAYMESTFTGPMATAGVLRAGEGKFFFNRELLTRSSIEVLGNGIGFLSNLINHEPSLARTISEFCWTGDGSAFKTVKTRRLYRGSASDPQDAPISACWNNQGNGLRMRRLRFSLDTDYSDNSPTNYGSNWDVGFFNGSRVGVVLEDCQFHGYFREASIWSDATRGYNMPELDPRYPTDVHAKGADQFQLRNVLTIGGKWGFRHLGPLPKPGLMARGFQYTRAAKVVFSGLPANNDAVSIGAEVYTFKTAPVGRKDVLIGSTLAATISSLMFAFNRDREPIYDDLTFAPGETEFTIYSKSPSTTAISIVGASAVVQTISGAAATQTEAIADPARYFDQVLGALVDDGRNSLNASDLRIDNCIICSVEHHSGYRMTDIRGDRNYLLDAGGGALEIDGLGGASVIHKFAVMQTRFHSSEPFIVKLGMCARGIFVGNNLDSNVSNTLSTSGAALTSADQYERVTGHPYLTGRIEWIGVDDPGTTQYPIDRNGNQERTPYRTRVGILASSAEARIGTFARIGEKNTGATSGYVEVVSGSTGNAELRLSNEAYPGVAVVRATAGGLLALRTRVSGNGDVADRVVISDTQMQVMGHVRPSGTSRQLGASFAEWAAVYATDVITSGAVKTGSFTVATLPSAAVKGAGSMVFVSNESGGAVVAFSDGTAWRRVTDRAVIS